MGDRAVVFIDGNNFYHFLRDAGVKDLFRLDYAKISKKLLGPRDWIATRYYIGRVDIRQGSGVYADQRAFVAALEKTHGKISVSFGRLEPRKTDNEAAKELKRYLAGLTTRIDPAVYADLSGMAARHHDATVWVEKAVDVKIAVDMVAGCCQGEYDAAYLISADGDFTSAVEFVRNQGKKVYAASPGQSAVLAKVVNSFIPLRADWFKDCYKD